MSSRRLIYLDKTRVTLMERRDGVSADEADPYTLQIEDIDEQTTYMLPITDALAELLISGLAGSIVVPAPPSIVLPDGVGPQGI